MESVSVTDSTLSLTDNKKVSVLPKYSYGALPLRTRVEVSNLSQFG